MSDWERVKWEGNRNPPYRDWECYRKKFPGTGVTVTIFPGMWKDALSFCVKGQYTGCLPGITTFDAAKAELDKRFSQERDGAPAASHPLDLDAAGEDAVDG